MLTLDVWHWSCYTWPKTNHGVFFKKKIREKELESQMILSTMIKILWNWYDCQREIMHSQKFVMTKVKRHHCLSRFRELSSETDNSNMFSYTILLQKRFFQKPKWVPVGYLYLIALWIWLWLTAEAVYSCFHIGRHFFIAWTWRIWTWRVDGDRHFFDWMSFNSIIRKMRGSLSGENVQAALSHWKTRWYPQSREGDVSTRHVHCTRKVPTI